jgi:hypothetical protein
MQDSSAVHLVEEGWQVFFVKDMHYEARVQAVIQYHAIFEERKIDKDNERNMTLTKEQYLLVNTDFS